VSDFQSRAGLHPLAFGAVSEEAFSEERFDHGPEPTEPPPAREGLPANYRMRHDAHYVDQLMQPAAPPIRRIPVRDIDAASPVAGWNLAPLVSSIARFGVLEPLLVRRHEGRYELIGGRKRLAAAAAAGLSEVPCLVHEVDDRRARALSEATKTAVAPEVAGATGEGPRRAIPAAALTELTDHLDAIGACLTLLPDRERPLREQVATELIRAESRRASRLLRGLAVLAEDPPIANRSVGLRALVERTVALMQPERRLADVDVIIEPGTEDVRVPGDEALLALALAGALAAMQAVVQKGTGGRITCTWRHDPARAMVRVEIAQSAVTLPVRWLGRFFDLAWTERPGGYGAAIDALAAKRIAELHNGTAAISARDEGGCTLRLELRSDNRGA
jgi:hypothetical protein